MISDKAIDNMTRGAKIYTKLNIDINEFPASDIYDALQELKEYRECELRPATKFVNTTFEEQLDHVKSEIKEIEKAANAPLKTYDYYALLDEITDAQHSLQTLKVVAGATRRDDFDSHRRVIKKNEVRGYYNAPSELDELSKAAAPLIELMQRKYNPHHKIIVTLDGVEVLSGKMGVPAEVQD